MLPRTGKVVGSLALAAALAAPSSALAASHHAVQKKSHLTKREERVIRAKLLREIKHNPKLIKNKSWLKEADLVDFSLPITIRLNPAGAPSGNVYNNNATLNLGPSLGSRTVELAGELHGDLNFQDAFGSGQPGDAQLTLNPDTTSGGQPTGLTSSSVPLLTNTNTSTDTPSSNPAADGCVGATGGEDSLSNLSNSNNNPGDDNLGAGAVSPQPNAQPGDVVLRTGGLSIGIAGGTAPTGAPNAGAIIGASGGTANLFNLPINGASGASVDVKVNLLTDINSVERVVDAASTDVPSGPYQGDNLDCRQVWTGYVPNVLSTELVGSLVIAPAITADGHLRIARTFLQSESASPETVAACLVPDSFYTGDQTAPGATGSINTAPNVACDSDPSSILQGYAGTFGTNPPFGTPGNGTEVELGGSLSVNSLAAEVLLGDV